MKKIFNRINETGTMLVEALAMLGLIAMVTPVLYKKAAERTTELQDINASNQLRVLADAMDAYIKDNFTRITNGETVVNSCNVGEVDYSTMDASGGTVTFDMSHLCEYLPYGFLKDGVTQDSKLFTNADPSFQVALKKTTGTELGEDGTETVVAETITGFLTAVPNEGEDFPSTRLARIATMVGSNGGFVQDDGTVMGAQGIWQLTDASEVGLGGLPPRTFVVSSLQPISSQGLANEDVLHRKTERQNDYVLNSMETDLFMSYNDKNHNIRQVNQIIMQPQLEWMLGGDENDFTRSTDDTPTMEYGQTYEANLDYTLYIGEKGGAYMEGNLAALSSLFTVRSEEGENGGIKYYETNSSTDTTDPTNPVTTTNKGNAVFSVTSDKMEYGNIDGATAGVLLTVDKGGEADGGSMTFVSKTTDTDGVTGETTVSGTQSLIAANAARVNVMDGALSVRNPNQGPDGGKYDDNDTGEWANDQSTPGVIVGGGDIYKGAYTTYSYTDDGTGTGSRTPDIGNDGTFTSNNYTGEHALTVNGPAFIKDSLTTAKVKAYNVDAATLRAGVHPKEFNELTNDKDFYLIAEQKGTAADPEGRMLVGQYEDAHWSDLGSNERFRYRLQIAEADELPATDAAGNVRAGVQRGIGMEHEGGINLRSGSMTDDMHVALVGYDPDTDTTTYDNVIDPGQVKIGAYNSISLSTMHPLSSGNRQFSDGGTVTIQDDMLRAYNISNGEGTNTEYGNSVGYIDSVTDNFRLMSRTMAGMYSLDDLYRREEMTYSDNRSGLFALGDVDFTLSEAAEAQLGGTDFKLRPVVDIKARRDSNYISSRFSGGFAIYDYDAEYDVTPGATIPDEYPDKPLNVKGNPSLYVSKGDFQILATETNDTDPTLGIEKGDIILQVDNNSDTGVIADSYDRGSVYIRKGAINIAGTKSAVPADDVNRKRLTNSDIQNDYRTDGFNDGTTGDVYPTGYIAADRFIAHMAPTRRVAALLGTAHSALGASSAKLSGNDISGAGGETLVPYERYEVNPAYTSVMHDIKLTTRGGARLSDILPDFINKGIYVVDNTYADDVRWASSTTTLPTSDLGDVSMETYTSAYLGFVPTPTCPQGYSKVITINPAGWAMAQAGTPVSRDGNIDISTHNNPYLYWYTNDKKPRTDVDEIEAVNPLTFQKSTWLKAMVAPACDSGSGKKLDLSGTCRSGTFKGWGAIMGFVYPKAYYADFLEWSGTVDKGSAHDDDVQGSDSQTVYWNLYPVQYRQLEAYVTVYCYFNRTTTGGVALYPTDMVDSGYDQLKDFRDYWEKDGGEYEKRLNDPALKYNDPW